MRHVRSALLAIAFAAGLALPASAWAGGETPAWQAGGSPVAALTIRETTRDGRRPPGSDEHRPLPQHGRRAVVEPRGERADRRPERGRGNGRRRLGRRRHGHLYGSNDAGEPWAIVEGVTASTLLAEGHALYLPASVGPSTYLLGRVVDGVVEDWSTGLPTTAGLHPAGADPSTHRVYVRQATGQVWWRAANGAAWAQLASAGALDDLALDTTTTPATLVGVHGATLRRSADGGATWTSTALPLTAPAAAVGRIGVHGGDIVLTTGGYDVFGVIARSADDGATWTTMSTPPGTSQTYAGHALGGGDVLVDTERARASPRRAHLRRRPRCSASRWSTRAQAGHVGTTYTATVGAWWGATSWSTQWQRCDDQWVAAAATSPARRATTTRRSARTPITGCACSCRERPVRVDERSKCGHDVRRGRRPIGRNPTGARG